MSDFTSFKNLGPSCFITGNAINYKGQWFYQACDEFVADNADGGQAFCVKRINHPGKIHEAYDGRTLEDVTKPEKLSDDKQ